jgi:hypothetical protein
MATADDYEWIHDSLDDAACVTVVVGKDSAGVLAAFNADASLSVPIDDSDGYVDGRVYVSVLDVPGAVIALEYNGFQGSLPEVLGAASSDGRAASMFWNVNDDNAFSCAAGGETLASVDMYDAEDPEATDELPEDLTALFAGAGASDADLHATGLAMVEEFTGIRVTPEHLASMTVAHPIIGGG